ncbi:MAG: OmpA family protein, partial [Myxococcota bacterium]
TVSTSIRPPQIISEQVMETPSKAQVRPNARPEMTTREITEDLLLRHDLDGEGWITRRPDGVEVHIHGDVAFEQGTSRLTARSTSLVRELVGMTRGAGLEMWVETHVDQGQELSASASGWELALRRTDAVGRYAIRQGTNSSLLRLAGYGYSAGRNTQEFLRQSELLSIRFKLPQGAAEADLAKQAEELN